MPKVEVNNYVQIYGNVKTNKGKKVLMAFKIIPVTDVNAITFHYLQCINNKVKMEAESKKVILKIMLQDIAINHQLCLQTLLIF